MSGKMILLAIATVLLAPISSSALDYILRPSLALQERYDDNIFITREDRVNDWITMVTPGLDLAARSGRTELGLQYSLTFNRYASNNDQDNISHRASARAIFRLYDNFTLRLTDTFVKTEDPADIRAIEGAGPVLRRDNRHTTNIASASAEYRASERLLLSLTGAYTDSRNSRDSLTDVKTVAGTLGAGYRLTERLELLARTVTTFYDYQETGDARGQDFLAGFSYKLTPSLNFNALGGISIVKTDVPDRTTEGFLADVSLTKMFEQGSAMVGYRKAVIAGVQNESPLNANIFLFRYTRPLTTRLDMGVAATHGRFKSVSGGEENRRDITVSADATYKLLPWANLLMAYQYVDSKDKDNNAGSYYNHLVTVGIRITGDYRF